MIEAWRAEYNQRRPHSSLGHLTPNEFVGQRQAIQTVERSRLFITNYQNGAHLTQKVTSSALV